MYTLTDYTKVNQACHDFILNQIDSINHSVLAVISYFVVWSHQMCAHLLDSSKFGWKKTSLRRN